MPPADKPSLPRPPDKPHEDECCHRGCCPCIFDYYYDALERWEALVRARGEDPAQVLARMSPSGGAPAGMV